MSERELLAGEFAILAILRVRPMHGYDMAAFLAAEGLLDVLPMEQSTLYTYLRNLEARALVSWTEERIGNRPPRKTYALTTTGHGTVEAWLRRPVQRMREIRLEFLLKVFFLGRIDPAAMDALLADQVALCERYLARLAERVPGTPFERLVLASRRSAAEATLAWLSEYRETPVERR